jgi:hypothetical protein
MKSETNQTGETDFPLFRLSKSKKVCDISPNTIRAYARQGLPLYRRGKAVFVAKADLAKFILQGRA